MNSEENNEKSENINAKEADSQNPEIVPKEGFMHKNRGYIMGLVEAFFDII